MASQEHRHPRPAGFGYRQELNRTLGQFSSFAAAFSLHLHPHRDVPALRVRLRVRRAGVLVGLDPRLRRPVRRRAVLRRARARYPIAGSVYQWGKQVAGRSVAWFAGWIMMIASIVTVAAVAIAWQIILPQISSKFQFVGDGTGRTTSPQNAVILGIIRSCSRRP